MKDAKSLFEDLRKKTESQVNGSLSGGFGNPNILKLKRDNSYKLRLLWIQPSKGIEREYPMINQFVHKFWDDTVTSGPKGIQVYCKTSQYDEGETRAGFDCPVCKRTSELYKEASNGSSSAKELYSKFKRQFIGYVPVYVVSGPVEDIGKIKILQYPKTFRDFFDLNIFNVDHKKNKNTQNDDSDEESEAIGIEAFVYYDSDSDSIITKGRDLIVMVGTKKVPVEGKGNVDMPDYNLKFSHKLTDVDLGNMDIERYLNLSEELNFDKDLCKKSTTEELLKFKAKYLDGGVITEEVEDSIDIDESAEAVRKIAPPMKKPTPKPTVVTEETEDEETPFEADEQEEKPILKTAKKVESKSDDELDDLLSDIEDKKPTPKKSDSKPVEEKKDSDIASDEIDALLADL